MKSWLRRLRGVLGIGTIWGVAGAVLAPIPALVIDVVPRYVPLGFYLSHMLLSSALYGAITGFVLGSGFAGALTVIERRRTLEELSTARAAAWAAIVGVGLPMAVLLVLSGPERVIHLLMGYPFVVLAIAVSHGVVSGALAAGTVSLAKRAPSELGPGPLPDDEELLGVAGDG